MRIGVQRGKPVVHWARTNALAEAAEFPIGMIPRERLIALRRVAKPTASPQQSPVTKFLAPHSTTCVAITIFGLSLTLSSAVHQSPSH
jgi:hypothetical protein